MILTPSPRLASVPLRFRPPLRSPLCSLLLILDHSYNGLLNEGATMMMDFGFKMLYETFPDNDEDGNTVLSCFVPPSFCFADTFPRLGRRLQGVGQH